jgi:adenylate cyclase
MPTTRRLAAILAADIAGYSRLMGEDEEGTLVALKAIRRDLGDPKIDEHRGRIVKTTGDGLLIEFASVVDAVRCAVEIQRAMSERNAEIAEARQIRFRIGINLGDVIIDDGDIYGDGVNIAARLEGLAEPGGICVSRVVHDQVRDKLDIAFADIGEQALKNIVRPVGVYAIAPASPHPNPPPQAGEGSAHSAQVGVDAAPAFALPDKPSIAVLPFQNMSGDPEQEYFADGMVEEIITALSRIRWLFVIARNSTFTYKGQAVDVKQVGRELGVRYVLEGSVRKGGNRVRITGQLIDAATGTHLWADRYDGSLDDVFDLQDKVASAVAGVIEPALQAAETVRAARRPTTDMSAYEAYLRANAMLFTSTALIPQALALLEDAISRDPNYGPALGLAAILCMRLYTDRSSQDREADRWKGMDYGYRAVRAAGDDAGALANAAFALSVLGEDIGSMIAMIDRALALNPSHARGWYISGTLRLFAGEPDTAIEHLETAQRLSPRARLGVVNLHIGMAYLVSRRFEEALPKLLLETQNVSPEHPAPNCWLAACYAHLGRLDDARRIVEQLLAVNARAVEDDAAHFRNPEHREVYLSGLRLAMGEKRAC